MDSVFLVQHLNVLPSGKEGVKLIGIYPTMEGARAAVVRLAEQPGFCKHPSIINSELADEIAGFHIEEHELDKDHWLEGFVTLVGNEEYRE